MSFENDFFESLKMPDFSFEEMALKLFRYQASNNRLYELYLDLLGCKIQEVSQLSQIPFLPVTFFKNYKILTEGASDAFEFNSSTTTGNLPSRHFVPDLSLYEWSFRQAFQTFYGPHQDYCILGLLPNYLERGGSSLVYMVQQMIDESKYRQSNFYLHDFAALHQQLKENEAKQIPTLLIGVTYALLDFAAAFPMPLQYTIVMETGGMKGRREELLRQEVHSFLKSAFGLEHIHSEYGMTELLSQAYSKGEGLFHTPSTMRVMIADTNDPLSILPKGKAGSVNIIDLCNIYSCAFIATDDLGIVHPNNSFEIIGRKDHSETRGCGLMYTL